MHGSDRVTVQGSDRVAVHGSDRVTVHGSDRVTVYLLGTTMGNYYRVYDGVFIILDTQEGCVPGQKVHLSGIWSHTLKDLVHTKVNSYVRTLYNMFKLNLLQCTVYGRWQANSRFILMTRAAKHQQTYYLHHTYI